jgi:hypothetical protein
LCQQRRKEKEQREYNKRLEISHEVAIYLVIISLILSWSAITAMHLLLRKYTVGFNERVT